MKERDIEAHAREAIERAGGRMFKWVSPGHRGVPDDIVFWPGGHVHLIELKSPGESPDAQQEYMHKLLRSLGAVVLVFDSIRAVDSYVKKAAG